MLINQKANKMGFGVAEIMGLATVILIAAVVIVPGLRGIATDIMTSTREWVSGQFTSIFNITPTGTP